MRFVEYCKDQFRFAFNSICFYQPARLLAAFINQLFATLIHLTLIIVSRQLDF